MADKSIAKVSLFLGMDGTQLDKGLDQSSQKIKKWGDTAKTTTKQAGDQFAQGFKLPDLPQPKPMVWDIKQNIIRDQTPLEQKTESVRQGSRLPNVQTQLPTATQLPLQKAFEIGFGPIAGIATAAIAVVKALYEVGVKGRSVADALNRLRSALPQSQAAPQIKAVPPPLPAPVPMAAIPIEQLAAQLPDPVRRGPEPKDLRSPWGPLGPLASKGVPVRPVPLSHSLGAGEDRQDMSFLRDWEKGSNGTGPLPNAGPPLPRGKSTLPQKYKKGTADDDSASEKGAWKDLMPDVPPGPPRKTTLPEPPRFPRGAKDKDGTSIGGRLRPYYVVDDPLPAPKPEIAPGSFYKASDDQARKLDLHNDRNRFRMGGPLTARERLPKFEAPVVDVNKLGIPKAKEATITPSAGTATLAKSAPPPLPPRLPTASGAGGDLGGAVAGGLPMALKIALPFAALAAGFYAIVKLRDAFSEVAEKARVAGEAARGLGVGLSGFLSIGHAAQVAGVSAETLSSGISNMNAVLKGSDKEAGRVFGQIGLSFEELRGLPIDESIAKIAGALTSISDPTKQAKAGIEIFGDSFTRLQPLLNQGPEGLRALSAEARKLGIAFGEADGSKLEMANQSIKRLGAGWDGLKNTLAIASAPFIDVIATGLLSAKNALVDFQSALSSDTGQAVLGGLRTAIGYVWDALQAGAGLYEQYIAAPLLRAWAVVADVLANMTAAITSFAEDFALVFGPTWETLKSGLEDLGSWFSQKWDEIVGFFDDAWDSIRETVTDVYNWLPSPIKDAVEAVAESFAWLVGKITAAWDTISGLFKKTKIGDTIRDVADAVQADGKSRVDAFGTTADKLEKAFADVESKTKAAGDRLGKLNPLDELRAKILKGITDLESELRDSMQKIGLTSAQSKIFDLKKQGASDADLAKVKEMADLAKSVDIAFANIQMPPLETFDRSITGLNELFDNGRINLQQYQNGLVQASKQLESSVGLSQTKTVSAQFAGSKDAVSTEIKAQLQQDNQDPVANLLRAQMEAKEIQKKQLETAIKLNELIEQQNFEAAFAEF